MLIDVLLDVLLIDVSTSLTIEISKQDGGNNTSHNIVIPVMNK